LWEKSPSILQPPPTPPDARRPPSCPPRRRRPSLHRARHPAPLLALQPTPSQRRRRAPSPRAGGRHPPSVAAELPFLAPSAIPTRDSPEEAVRLVRADAVADPNPKRYDSCPSKFLQDLAKRPNRLDCVHPCVLLLEFKCAPCSPPRSLLEFTGAPSLSPSLVTTIG